jgi:ATPase inhibitor subunit zeta
MTPDIASQSSTNISTHRSAAFAITEQAEYGSMTNFNDRGRGFETGFARQQDLLFRITARRNRLAGK